MREKCFLLFLIFILLISFAGSCKDNDFEREYNIICLDVEIIDPFNEKYPFSDKKQKQDFIKKVEKKYNIKINFNLIDFEKNDFLKGNHVYYGLENNLSVNVKKNHNGYIIEELFVPLHDFVTGESLINTYCNDYNNDKLELGTSFNKNYMFYPGKLYSYNFLYYDDKLELGEFDPQYLLENNEWNLEQYKYLLENLLSSAVNKKKLNDFLYSSSIFASTPSDLAMGLLAANGYNFINRNNLDYFNDEKYNIIDQVETLFFDYYGYIPSELIYSQNEFKSDFVNYLLLSRLCCDKTLVSIGYKELLNIFYKKKINIIFDNLLKIVPYPSENYEKFTSYTDTMSQYGYALINDDELYDEKFTKDISFNILYDLTEGYYEKYPDVQKQNITEFLSNILTSKSIDIFFEYNKKISIEMGCRLQNFLHCDGNAIIFQAQENRSINYFLISNPKYSEYGFMQNFLGNGYSLYCAENFKGKFKYDVASFDSTNNIEYVNIIEYFIREYRKFVKA